VWQTGAVRPGHSNDDAATSNYNRHSIPRAAFHGLTGARMSRDYEITSQQSWRTWLHSVYFLHRNFSQPSTIDYRAHTVIVSDFVFHLITFATCWVESGSYLYRIVWRRTICTRCLSAFLFFAVCDVWTQSDLSLELYTVYKHFTFTDTRSNNCTYRRNGMYSYTN